MTIRSTRAQATAALPNVAPKRQHPSSDNSNLKSRKRPLINGGRSAIVHRSARAQPSHTAASDPRLASESTGPLQVFVCGAGEFGELGLGVGKKATNVRGLNLNPNLSDVVSISTGGMHGIALTQDNHLLTWGVNDAGALGRDTEWEGKTRDIDATSDSGSASDSDSDNRVELNPREATPTEVDQDHFAPGTKFACLAAGDSATWVSTVDGRVYGWGKFRDHNGDYGFTYDESLRRASLQRTSDHGIVKSQPRPFLLPNLKKIVQLSAGADYVLALDSLGRVFAWGCGEQYELGHRIVQGRRPQALLPALVEIPRRYKIRSIHAAANHAFAIDQEGNTWSWGLNNFGQTGISHNAGQAEAVVSRPTRVDSLLGRDMQSIAGGLHHSIGMTRTGQCLVWGRLDGGQLGLDVGALIQEHPEKLLLDIRGKPRCLLNPIALPLPRCEYVAAGSDHCLAVTSDGRVYAWGFNATHQCAQATEADITVPKLMAGKAIHGVNIVWAGAGGQYSMVAAVKEDTA